MPSHTYGTSEIARLQLAHEPVAIAFLQTPPAGIPKLDRSAAASCSYWRLASEGQSFYTTADDHQNCPVGSFTHGVPLTPLKGQELNELVGVMVDLNYLTDVEVPMIPHRTDPLEVAAYAPLSQATFPADVVVFRGTPRQIMLLSEAARRAGAFDLNLPMGRPACAMLPQAIGSGSGVASVGCIGNRVYTGLSDEELYLAVPGSAVERVLGEVETIVNANIELEKFHRARAASLA